MNELNKIIEDYLNAKDTDYAIMINGEWGCGKSYYIKHGFQEVVTSVDCPIQEVRGIEKLHDAGNEIAREIQREAQSDEERMPEYDQSKYYPFYVSLYGVSSVEDFNAKLSDGVHDWLGKGKTILKSFFKNRFDVDLPISPIARIPQNAVLVFDDLERICLDKISPIEVLGLINTFSEHKHYKVVIVCNEEAFRKKAEDGSVQLKLDEEYKQYKEKTIRFTYTCKADIPEIYGILASEYSGTYGEYLKEKEEDILSIFDRGGKRNIRTLKFFMDIFEKIFNTAYPVLSGEYCDQILDKLLCSTMIYVLEHKRGHSKRALRQLSAPLILADIEEEYNPFDTREDDETGIGEEYDVNKVRNRYLSSYDYMVRLLWLIDYITSGALDEEELLEFVKNQTAEFKRIETSPAAQALAKIKNLKAINDEEAAPIVQQIWQYIEQNQFTVTELLDVYSLFITYVNEGLDFVDLGKEKDAVFEKALRESPGLQDCKLDNDARVGKRKKTNELNEYQKRYYKLVEYVKNLKAESNENRYAQKVEAFLKEAESADPSVEGVASYKMDDHKISMRGMDWERLYRAIVTVPNPKACMIIDVVEILIASDRFGWTDDEQLALNEFWCKLNVYRRENRNKIRAYEIRGLVQTLQEVLEEKQKTVTLNLNG